MELFQAHNQWSSRPADQRFATIRALYDAAKGYAVKAVEKEDVRVDSIRTQAQDGEVMLVGQNNVARLTNWAFGQLAAFAGAPAGYLRDLPATLAVQNLNHGLANRLQDAKDKVVNLLIHPNGGLLVRALTSDKYSRIWNYEVAERLLEMESQGWVPATPTFNKRDDGKDDTALYASDHDLFAFITRPDRVLAEPGNPQGLLRGLIAVNSEVGARKLILMRFLYREMCGNHIIWGAQDVIEMSSRHMGDIKGRFASWEAEIKRYMDSSGAQEEAQMRKPSASSSRGPRRKSSTPCSDSRPSST